jgi:hypothetical protein
VWKSNNHNHNDHHHHAMDLYKFNPNTDLIQIERLLESATHLFEVIDKPKEDFNPDRTLLNCAGNPTAGDIRFSKLIAEYHSAVTATETNMTPFQRKQQRDRAEKYRITNFLQYMSKQQRCGLKRALREDVQPFIDMARRNATDAVPKLFDGAPLPSASTADVRDALLALQAEAEEQLDVLKSRIAALGRADIIALGRMERDLKAAEKTELLFIGGADAAAAQQSNKRAKH